MFKITMLPARHGDCLWIEYGKEAAPKRILIDTGPVSTYKNLRERISGLPPDDRCFELFIITHVDADHIEGALPLLQDKELGVKYKDIWFNGWKHIAGHLAPVHGEYLSSLLQDQSWNRAFDDGQTVVVPVEGELPRIVLADNMTLTLLSPSKNKLNALKPLWEKTVTEARLKVGDLKGALAQLREKKKFGPMLGAPKIDIPGLASATFEGEEGAANGSSIAVLAEYEGKRCLFAADAHAPLLETNIGKLNAERQTERLELDAFKVSHHGSKNNLSNELLQKIACDRYLISTNGSYFRHPDNGAVARIIQNGRSSSESCPTLYFNYRSEYNKKWENQGWKDRYRYETVYPANDGDGLSVLL